jgi:hypothetical protein
MPRALRPRWSGRIEARIVASNDADVSSIPYHFVRPPDGRRGVSAQPDVLRKLRSYRAWIPAALITLAHLSISWVR